MNGAREFYGLFRGKEQIGRLFISASRHARGSTLHVWVLPEGVEVEEGCWPGSNSVEVYGITGGNPGWTESYGWLRRGPWEQDFAKIVEDRRAAGKKYQEEQAAKRAAEAAEAEAKERALLATYSQNDSDSRENNSLNKEI